MKLHTGDTILVITGKDKGKQGKILRVLPKISRVVVEGINMRTRHIKKTPNQAGQRITYEASVHISNVMILDPKTKKPTRIGFKIDEKTGKKARIARVSGEVISKAAAAKAPAKKTGTKAAASTKKEEVEEKKVEPTAKPAIPGKTPFWKRGSKGDSADESGAESSKSDSKAMPSVHRSQGG